jgi:hypothetical protein
MPRGLDGPQAREWIIQRCICAARNEYEDWPGYCETLLTRDEMFDRPAGLRASMARARISRTQRRESTTGLRSFACCSMKTACLLLTFEA